MRLLLLQMMTIVVRASVGTWRMMAGRLARRRAVVEERWTSSVRRARAHSISPSGPNNAYVPTWDLLLA